MEYLSKAILDEVSEREVGGRAVPETHGEAATAGAGDDAAKFGFEVGAELAAAEGEDEGSKDGHSVGTAFSSNDEFTASTIRLILPKRPDIRLEKMIISARDGERSKMR